MATINDKITDYLIELLISKGKLDGSSKAKVLEVRHAIIYGLENRQGAAKAVERIANSYQQYNNLNGYLYRTFYSLPIKPPPKTIEQEIAEEASDIEEHIQLIDELNTLYEEDEKRPYFTESTPEELLEGTTYLDTAPYKGERELYAEYTYLVVFNEAGAEKTSMHEICRRRGLIYDLLIK